MLRSLSATSSSSSLSTRATSGRYFAVPILIYLQLRLLRGQVRARNHLTVPACSSTNSPQHWCATCGPFPGITALLTQRSPSQLFKPSPHSSPGS